MSGSGCRTHFDLTRWEGIQYPRLCCRCGLWVTTLRGFHSDVSPESIPNPKLEKGKGLELPLTGGLRMVKK